MGSNSPAGFQDLNDFPHRPSGFRPMIEPKLEPLDDHPPPPPGFDLEEPTSVSPTPSLFSSDTDVYSEFCRISNLFHSAFSERLQNCVDAAAVFVSDPNSGAIVPVDAAEPAVSSRVLGKCQSRSSELVRVTDLKPDDQRYFRESIRKTRILFDSLRVFAAAENEKIPHRRASGDARAAALMRHCGLWLNRDKRIVGDIPGIYIGDVFFFRMELCVVGLHGQCQAGIDYVPASQSSNGEPIATSIIVSGGYEDDEDGGDVISYTGHGGQDKHGRQVVHQKLERGNLAMERSMSHGVEVRVIRGFKFGNGKVYVYDGLYRIIDTWFDVGKSGYGVFKFKLVRIENQQGMGSVILKLAQRLKLQPLEALPEGYLSLDLSRQKEKLPVSFYNDIDGDQEPLHYDYLTSTVFPPFVSNGGSKTGCECPGICLYNCFCAVKNGGEFPYDMNGVLVRGKPLIFECGPHCHCPPTCRNRVAQKGVRHRFQVLRSRETGWGVRSLDLILAGSFLCEYSGVVLTREQAQILSMNGDSLIHPGRFAKRWKEWGELSPIFSDYVAPTHPSVPPLDFSLDVSKMRNVACYMSHSSSPNVFVQPVLNDHNNVSFPRLMLFALENIPPMRELSLDYGVAYELTGKLALCN